MMRNDAIAVLFSTSGVRDNISQVESKSFILDFYLQPAKVSQYRII